MTIKAFLDYLQIEKGYSQSTVVAYKKDLEQFQDFFLEITSHWKHEDIQDIHVRQWLVLLMENGIEARSVARKLSALRSYFNYLIRLDCLKRNPLIGIRAPKAKKRLPEFVKEIDLLKLLDNLFDESSFAGARDKLIFELFYGTGIRRAELVSLTHKDVDIESSIMKVEGKRKKQRLLPLNQSLSKALLNYIEKKKENYPEEKGVLLVTDKGMPVYPEFVHRIVKRYLSLVSTSVKQSPHVLRHSFATALLNRGADLNSVKELLGHASLAATEVYTHSTFEQLTKVYNQAHPRA